MPMPYQGQLNQNVITSALFNMIISQHVFDSKVASTELADMFRVDGTLYGDTKLYHSFDIGSPEDWGNDAEAADLLKLNRNKSGKTQSIEMGVYKMIWITIDHYLSKQAFMKEGSFADFTGFLTGSLRKVKRVYDRSLINVELGTLAPATDRCTINIVTPAGDTEEEANRLEAQTIAAKMVVLKAELEDNNRDFNSLGYLRSYPASDLIAIWNVEKHAKITKLDLPSIFHDGIDVEGGLKQYDLPAKWFGTKATQDLEIPTSAPSSVANRILVSGWYDVSTKDIELVSKPDGQDTVFLWAGDPVPYAGQQYTDHVRGVTVTVYKDTSESAVSTVLPKEYYYAVDDTVAFVLVDKNSLPFMSGFEVGTEFYNPRALTNTSYLIFGHNNLEFLEEYPRIKVTVTQET